MKTKKLISFFLSLTMMASIFILPQITASADAEIKWDDGVLINNTDKRVPKLQVSLLDENNQPTTAEEITAKIKKELEDPLKTTLDTTFVIALTAYNFDKFTAMEADQETVYNPEEYEYVTTTKSGGLINLAIPINVEAKYLTIEDGAFTGVGQLTKLEAYEKGTIFKTSSNGGPLTGQYQNSSAFNNTLLTVRVQPPAYNSQKAAGMSNEECLLLMKVKFKNKTAYNSIPAGTKLISLVREEGVKLALGKQSSSWTYNSADSHLEDYLILDDSVMDDLFPTADKKAKIVLEYMEYKEGTTKDADGKTSQTPIVEAKTPVAASLPDDFFVGIKAQDFNNIAEADSGLFNIAIGFNFNPEYFEVADTADGIATAIQRRLGAINPDSIFCNRADMADEEISPTYNTAYEINSGSLIIDNDTGWIKLPIKAASASIAPNLTGTKDFYLGVIKMHKKKQPANGASIPNIITMPKNTDPDKGLTVGFGVAGDSGSYQWSPGDNDIRSIIEFDSTAFDLFPAADTKAKIALVYLGTGTDPTTTAQELPTKAIPAGTSFWVGLQFSDMSALRERFGSATAGSTGVNNFTWGVLYNNTYLEPATLSSANYFKPVKSNYPKDDVHDEDIYKVTAVNKAGTNGMDTDAEPREITGESSEINSLSYNVEINQDGTLFEIDPNSVPKIFQDNVAPFAGGQVGDKAVIMAVAKFTVKQDAAGKKVLQLGLGQNIFSMGLGNTGTGSGNALVWNQNASVDIDTNLKTFFDIADKDGAVAATKVLDLFPAAAGTVTITKPTVTVASTATKGDEITLPADGKTKAGETDVDYTIEWKDENNNIVKTVDTTTAGLKTYIGTITYVDKPEWAIEPTGEGDDKVTVTVEVRDTQKIVIKSVNAVTVESINANNAKNTEADIASLLPSTVTAVDADGAAHEVSVTWTKNADDAYDVKGGDYTFTAELGETDTYDYTTNSVAAPTAKITVKPVKASYDSAIFDKVQVKKGAKVEKFEDLKFVTEGKAIIEPAAEGAEVVYTVSWTPSYEGITAKAGSYPFTGVISFKEAPEWLTLPTVLTGEKTLQVTQTRTSGGGIIAYSSNVKDTALYEEAAIPTLTPAINTKYTKPYASGYDEGEFLPKNNITRAELATMIARLIYEDELPDYKYAASFADIDANAWYSKYVGYLESFGILDGYEEDGIMVFKPEQTITRAEMATVITRAQKFAIDYSQNPFRDVENDYWAKDYITTLAAKNIITGYNDGSFGVTNPLTRAEAVVIINRLLEPSTAIVTFMPNDISGHWAEKEIILAVNERQVNGAEPITKQD